MWIACLIRLCQRLIICKTGLSFRGGTALHKLKVRALYQRKKGRDLFDLHKGLTAHECNVEKILECYRKYMEFVVDRAPSYKEFVQNMNEKMQDEEFLTDVEPLLRPEVAFNPQEAYQFLYDKVIERMIVPTT